jgi:hypothetical protein
MRWTLKPKASKEKVNHLSQALNIEEFILLKSKLQLLMSSEKISINVVCD